MDNEKRWYVVNTYSGHESKVKEDLEMRAESLGMQDNIIQVIIPEEKVIEEKNGVKKEKMKKLFPGYILVEMVMSDESWYVVRNTKGVTGFIGSSGKGAKPTPLQPEEIERILDKIGANQINVETELEVGIKVKVNDGPFKGMFGTVDEIDLDNNKVTVTIDLFGQDTQVEVELGQIQKA